MHPPLIVINPNSNEAVTRGIDTALAPLRLSGGPAIRCLTLHDGPAGVQTQRDIARVTPPLLELIRTHEATSGAFVIACFSDPALAAAREVTRRPVLGIGESALLTALTLGERFGVIAMQDSARARHLRTYGAMGILDRFAGEEAIGLSITALGDARQRQDRLAVVGRRLRDEHYADVLVMGCAGLAQHREALQRALGIPVVEPSQAAAVMALGRICLDWEKG
ncbi:Asp/Glu/hydantoin racemase [Pseudomonas duriflava]|uniref:Asp/Glu/hydantoin racemase n=1 Tax=Pseudomonas duriflava TaxID=459528 RepID=A0A562PYY3_9PSED|nr:aspartate/glutamate racemase family protein [Pseudomonas duriflava]TWI49604.1 Asp/Glu/hydantoin racemase [Pseudomonas duriflava]